LLLPIYDPSSFQPFTIVSIAISLALVPISLAPAAAPPTPPGKASIDLLGLCRVSPFGVMAALFCGVCTGSFFSLGPTLAQRVGLDGWGVALFMALGTLGGFALTGLLGWVSDKTDRRVLITALATSAAVILSAFAAFLPERLPTPANFLVVAAFGAFVIPTYSVVCAYVNDLVRNGDFVSASGGLLIAQGLGAATGPLFAGAAMSHFGPSGALYPMIAAQVLMASWGLLGLSRRAAARTPTPPLARDPSPSKSWC
jgi:predicted MFS family arabinose efflux permease